MDRSPQFIFPQPDLQYMRILTAQLCTVAYLLCLTALQPYKRPLHNLMAIVLQAGLFATFVGAMCVHTFNMLRNKQTLQPCNTMTPVRHDAGGPRRRLPRRRSRAPS